MDKKKKKLSPLARFLGFIQAGATLLTNIHLPNFAKGTLYQGGGKQKQLRLFFCHEHHSLLLFDGISIHHA